MKREDIVLGVEYCKTAPLAYGQEPHVTPAKVRFTSKDPNYRVVDTFATDPDHPEFTRIIKSEVTKNYHDLPRNMRLAKIENLDGPWKIYNPRDHEKGSLPAERWSNGEWIPTMVAPAAVHRTWAEHERNQAEARERAKARQLAAAPGNVATAYRDLIAAFEVLYPGEGTGMADYYVQRRSVGDLHLLILKDIADSKTPGQGEG